MIILKHVLARVCALDTDSALFRVNNSFEEKFNNCAQLHSKIELYREQLLERLHQYNLTVADRKLNNAVQNIRRAVFNQKKIKEKDILVVHQQDRGVSQAVTDYIGLNDLYNSELQLFNDVFVQEWNEKRSTLRELVLSDVIQNGLLLSSLSLVEVLKKNKYNAKSATKKDRQVELGILKYITRSVFKPTPFSSFTHLNYTELDYGEGVKDNLIRSQNTTNGLKSYVRLNSSIFSLLRRYIVQIPVLYLHLDLQLNPSIKFIDETNEIKFLINKNNLEYFQTIQNNPIVGIIIELLKVNSAYKFIDVLNHCKDYVDADEEALTEYICKLINVGLLEFNFKASGTDISWIEKVYSNIITFPESSEKELLLKLLSHLEDSRKTYEGGFKDVDLRYRILSQTYDQLNENITELKKIINPDSSEEELNKKVFKKEHLLLEDTTSGNKLSINGNVLQPILAKLEKLIDHLSQNSSYVKKRSELYDYYNVTYKDEQIPLLQFYEEYYRFLKVKKAEGQEEQGNKTRSLNKKKYFSDDFYTVTKNSHSQFDFSLNEDAFSRKNTHSYSSSMFFQVANNDSQAPLIVCNGLGWGYGRMSSRFLYMFAEDFTEDIRHLNNRLNERKIFSEVNDASFFNANLHPPLFAHECIIPGGHKNVEDAFQLNVNKLNVKNDIENGQLVLVDSVSGKQVLVHDSCFQGEKGRSELFNLLLIFSDKVTPAHGLLISEINAKHQIKIADGIFIFPRITFEKTVVLQRKYWLINNSLPAIDLSEKDTDYFFRLNFWRKQYGIPPKVFVTIRGTKGMDPEKGPVSDDYKPQYVDFKNPVFLPLLMKIFKRSSIVRITEILPEPSDAIDFDGRKHATEFLVQWYNGKSFKDE